jgi:hypothetical protein
VEANRINNLPNFPKLPSQITFEAENHDKIHHFFSPHTPRDDNAIYAAIFIPINSLERKKCVRRYDRMCSIIERSVAFDEILRTRLREFFAALFGLLHFRMSIQWNFDGDLWQRKFEI